MHFHVHNLNVFWKYHFLDILIYDYSYYIKEIYILINCIEPYKLRLHNNTVHYIRHIHHSIELNTMIKLEINQIEIRTWR